MRLCHVAGIALAGAVAVTAGVQMHNALVTSQAPIQIVATTSVPAGSDTVDAFRHVGPESLYPDPEMTPGKADTLVIEDLTRMWTDNCPSGKSQCTYSQDHRNVPAHEHAEVYNEYGVAPEKRNIQNGEVDHFYPLCAGGSNDISNLWYQPAVNMWGDKNFGYHEKDKLEAYICTQIKAGTLSPELAFNNMTLDWVGWDMELQREGKLPTSGGDAQ